MKSTQKFSPLVESIINGISDIKDIDLFSYYFSLLEKLILKAPKFVNCFIMILTNFWLRYLYPEIFAKYLLDEKLFEYEFETTDLSSIGYHPYCPPPLHVWIYNRYRNL